MAGRNISAVKEKQKTKKQKSVKFEVKDIIIKNKALDVKLNKITLRDPKLSTNHPLKNVPKTVPNPRKKKTHPVSS